ncbi:PAS domain-containing protein [Salinibaculum rarum]|uniref:PAS domain-containing protein n=1 Tax=Salinibaculum rarum TaxID=3058903 RepID=UPI00265E1630|nr:PAS domain-containing protein [Salinibaculum sp. KK48]
MSTPRPATRTQNTEINVLHVDDDPGLAEVIATQLERADDTLNVEMVTSASDGLDYLAANQVHCIISDYDMSRQNGIEFLEEIREDYPDLPFILYTAKGNEDIASEAISAGVTDYFQKESVIDQYDVLANRVRNLVQRYRSEQRTRRQQKAIESAQEGISILNTEGEYLYVNQAYADLYGYDPEAMVGEHWELAYPDGETPFECENIHQSVLEDGLWSGETTGVKADGETFPIEQVVSRTKDEEIVCTVRDLTDQREREKELQLKNHAVEAAPVGITITDPTQDENPIIYANKEFESVTGYDREEIIGQNPRFLQGDDTSEEPVATMREGIDAEEPVTVELQNYRKDGTKFWNRVSIAPMHDEDGSVKNYVGFQEDITDYKRYTENLRALHDRSRELVAADTLEEAAELGVEAASEELGLDITSIHLYDPDQFGLAPVATTDAVHDFIDEPPVFTSGDSIAWRAYEQGEDRFIADVHNHPDRYDPDTPLRSELYLPLGDHGIMLAASPTPDAFDEQDFMLAWVLAASIESAMDQIVQTEELREREMELKKQNERLKEFISVVSHDVRNPVNVAEARIERAQEECGSDHLADVESALDRIVRITEDVLWLARNGQDISSLDSVALHNTVDHAWNTVADKEQRTTLQYADDFSSVAIEADPDHLQLLVKNLFSNAIEHGGEDVTVTVGMTDDGFYVEDNGSGIPEDSRDDVFVSGFSTSDEGTGFGLTIVKQIVEAHDWDIHVTESDTGGARFELSDVKTIST